MNFTDNINFKGKYKKYDPNGKIIKYVIGDTVEYDGEFYTATQTIVSIPPPVVDSGWKKLATDSNFYIDENPPSQLTYRGDRWFNPSTGILYTRIKDDNGMHWVEL
jgi:hypothetical protein